MNVSTIRSQGRLISQIARTSRATQPRSHKLSRCLSHASVSTPAFRRPFQPIISFQQLRHESSHNRPLTDRADQVPEANTAREEQPSYEMTFTCKQCSNRSTHKISKQGYHHGTILITCPGCKNRHLISDHLKIFSDKGITLEDILREKGQLLKKGTLTAGEEGDVEFWDDGTQQTRPPKS